MRIELPKVTYDPNKRLAHGYPFQIGKLTQEFLQGTFFYLALMDEAAGRYVRQEGAIRSIEEEFVSKGLDQRSIEVGWAAFAKHLELLKLFGSMHVVVALNSHWDWYIRSLAAFVRFALTQEGPFQVQAQRTLARLERRPILEQIAGIEAAAAVCIDLTSDEAEHLKEMSLIRNLALHNRWEVDEHYAKLSSRNRWELGEIREFEVEEAHAWNRSLLRVLNALSSTVAQRFKDCPAYPNG